MTFQVVLIASVLACANGENLIHNGDARSANGWERAGPSEWLQHDDDNGAGAPGSLRIAVPKDAQVQPYNWYQRVELPAKPPARLKLSAQIRLAGLTNGSTAAVMVQIFGEGTEPLAYAWTAQLTSDGAWRAVHGVFDVPKGATYIRVLAYLSGRGDAWFDDLVLEATDEPVTPPPGPASAVDDDFDSLARGCAADLPWIFDGEEARKAAAKSNRPVLLYVRCTDDEKHLDEARASIEAKSIRIQEDGYAKDLVFRAGPLSSPEIRDLIARRTIPVCATYFLSDSRFKPEKLAGFDVLSGEVTTPALILADERGKVLHKLDRLGALSDDFIDHWLRTVLDKPGAKSSAGDAHELYRDGELVKALAVATKNTPDDQLLRARILARLGRLEDARKAIGPLASAAADAMRGQIELRAGDLEQAGARFDEAATKLAGDAQLEARFWSAWCAALRGETSTAHERFRALAGPTPLGRRAAACALENGPRPYLAATQRAWPRASDLPTNTEGAQAGAFDLARSVTALLELQHDGGSFTETSGPLTQGFIEPAITAIVAEALAHVESKLAGKLAKRAKAARERAETFLIAYAAEESSGYFAMEPFNAPYAMETLVRIGDQRSCARLAERIAKRQLPDGNWTVYNPERPATVNTALSVRALWRASRRGDAVDKAVLERGQDALEAMRQSSGRFPYSTAAGHEWMSTEHGSIARDPLCEHVLLECGRGAKDALAKALARFLEHHAELRVPTKRLYDYFNDRGHAGYYYFFAYRNALEAARGFASKELQKKLVAATRASVLDAQEGDGTWMDKFLLGRAYGTAMALLLLE